MIESIKNYRITRSGKLQYSKNGGKNWSNVQLYVQVPDRTRKSGKRIMRVEDVEELVKINRFLDPPVWEAGTTTDKGAVYIQKELLQDIINYNQIVKKEKDEELRKCRDEIRKLRNLLE